MGGWGLENWQGNVLKTSKKIVGGWTTHLQNTSQNGNLPQTGVNIKKKLKPPDSWTKLHKRVDLEIHFLENQFFFLGGFNMFQPILRGYTPPCQVILGTFFFLSRWTYQFNVDFHEIKGNPIGLPMSCPDLEYFISYLYHLASQVLWVEINIEIYPNGTKQLVQQRVDMDICECNGVTVQMI